MYLALGVAMLTVYLCVTLNMNTLVVALACLYLALVLLRLILNPSRGFRFGPDSVHWIARKGAGSAALDELERVSVGSDVDGHTVCVLNFRDGRAVPLSGVEELDPMLLMREFGKRGVRIMN
ncbi:MAG: hypothetical protein R3E44_08560 [Paracoccaceae bacterium]